VRGEGGEMRVLNKSEQIEWGDENTVQEWEERVGR
jgi:hypothetical protein